MKNDDGFESDLLGLLALGTGFTLSSDPTVSSAFTSILKVSLIDHTSTN